MEQKTILSYRELVEMVRDNENGYFSENLITIPRAKGYANMCRYYIKQNEYNDLYVERRGSLVTVRRIMNGNE